MYSFIDTIDNPQGATGATGATGASSLPSEALSINGQYIENVIVGYRTLYVSGREIMETEVFDQEVGRSSGSIYQGKRTPSRTIIVGYQLLCSSPSDFRTKFNKLNSILNVEQAELIFADEPDKYFIGTPAGVFDVDPGLTNITSEFEIFCADPYKHSIYMKETTAVITTTERGAEVLQANIQNNGNVPVPIDFEITHNHENGYLGIVSEYGAMQYGDVSESDIAMSEVVLDAKSATEISYTPISDNKYFLSRYALNGTLSQRSMNNRVYLEYNPNNPNSTSYWHGGAGLIELPDWPYSGQKEIKNFKASVHLYFARTKAGQTGAFDFSVLAGDTIVASIQLWHDTDTNPYMYFKVNGKPTVYWRRKTTQLKLGSPGGIVSIEKSGGLFRMVIGGVEYTTQVDELEDQYIDGLAFASTQKKNLGYWKMPWIAWDQVFVRADVADAIIDVPNRYEEGSVFTVDGLSRKAYINGISAAEDEVVGSQYFNAQPGETQVQFVYSDFSDPAPTCKARIREAWL